MDTQKLRIVADVTQDEVADFVKAYTAKSGWKAFKIYNMDDVTTKRKNALVRLPEENPQHPPVSPEEALDQGLLKHHRVTYGMTESRVKKYFERETTQTVLGVLKRSNGHGVSYEEIEQALEAKLYSGTSRSSILTDLTRMNIVERLGKRRVGLTDAGREFIAKM